MVVMSTAFWALFVDPAVAVTEIGLVLDTGIPSVYVLAARRRLRMICTFKECVHAIIGKLVHCQYVTAAMGRL